MINKPRVKDFNYDMDLDFIDDNFKLDDIPELNIDFSDIDQALNLNFNDDDFNIDYDLIDTTLTDDTLLAFNIDEA